DNPRGLVRDFVRSLALLWRDPPARLSLAVTSLFWAAAAVLQFMVLRWATERLSLPLNHAAMLQIAVALGMVAGAVGAGRWIPLARAMDTLPLGLALGAMVFLMSFVTHVAVAIAWLAVIGLLAGLTLVPMNALLQSRGVRLMHPGQSIAVQNFYESLGSLVMLAVYAALVSAQVPLLATVAGFGLLITLAIGALLLRGRMLRGGADR
ncbi:MAG: lysophospholipid transporter LplT, partial [Gammaproteobacteria bacterium]|nr:lysophospholipid transporter LplT [Gammaproteobacteria bacterium]